MAFFVNFLLVQCLPFSEPCGDHKSCPMDHTYCPESGLCQLDDQPCSGTCLANRRHFCSSSNKCLYAHEHCEQRCPAGQYYCLKQCQDLSMTCRLAFKPSKGSIESRKLKVRVLNWTKTNRLIENSDWFYFWNEWRQSNLSNNGILLWPWFYRDGCYNGHWLCLTQRTGPTCVGNNETCGGKCRAGLSFCQGQCKQRWECLSPTFDPETRQLPHSTTQPKTTPQATTTTTRWLARCIFRFCPVIIWRN